MQLSVPHLSMPLFVNVDDVILRMQLSPQLDGINDVVTSGIIGAQLHIQRLIGAKLQRQHQDVTFFLDSTAYSSIQPGGVYRLEMPSGFIRSDTPIVITASDDVTQAGFRFNGGFRFGMGEGGLRFGVFTAVDQTFMITDAQKGYLLLDAWEYGDTYVHVICDTGFEDGTTPLPILGIPLFDTTIAYTVGQMVNYNGVVFVCVVASGVGMLPSSGAKWQKATVPMEQIPEDLYEAIMSLVPVVFDRSQTTNRNQEAINQYKTASDHAELLLQPYTRTKGFSFRPV